jgi:hypothetical protein
VAVLSLKAIEAFVSFGMRTAHVPILKYQEWFKESDHPRDEFGKWTSGFSKGAFASDEAEPGADSLTGNTVDAPENPKDGKESEPGWMGATPQMGAMALDDPNLDSAVGAENSGWLPHEHAFNVPGNMEVALAGAAEVSKHITNGDFAAAKKLLVANPSILFALRKQHQGSVKQAKQVASFLNAVTDATWVQHGTFVNKPKNQPPKEPLPVAEPPPPLPPLPKPVGAPKLLDFDPGKKLVPGTVGAMMANEGAIQIHAALSHGDIAGARKIAFETPSALTALYSMKHGSNLEAKSAASFLHLVTGQKFAQHGTKVNQPKGETPASSWSHPGFQGTGAPGYTPPGAQEPPPSSPQGAAQPPTSIIPPPGIMPPPSAAQQAKAPPAAQAWTPVEATKTGNATGSNPGGFYTLKDGTKGYAKFYCVAPSSRILQTDLSWKSASEIAVGDSVVGFDEMPVEGRRRKFQPSTVEGRQPIRLPSYRIRTSDGGEVVCSHEHRWLSKNGSNRVWKRADELKIGSELSSVGLPWTPDTSFEAGYLAGILDGEGSIARNEGTSILAFAQNPGPVLDATLAILKNMGSRVGVYQRGTYECVQAVVLGRAFEKARILGVVRPQRLLPMASALWEGVTIKATRKVFVTSVEYIGDQELIAIQTSTKTFVCEGLLSHNCNPEQMQTEVLANSMYAALGINAPKSKLVTIDGKKAIFSPLIEGGVHPSYKHGPFLANGVSMASVNNLQAHPQVQAGFAADAILANHDVFGLVHDNIMTTPDGQAHRIDNGGALKFRAQGEAKEGFTADKVGELDSMRNPAHGAGQVFQNLTDADVVKQVTALAQKMTPQEVTKLAQAAGFTGAGLAEQENVINGRIKAALAWSASKVVAGSPQAKALQNLHTQSTQQAPPPEAPAPEAPLGDQLLEGVNKTVPLDAENALTKPYKTAGALGTYNTIGTAITNKDEKSFAAAVTASSDHLAAAAQKTWMTEWPAQQMAKILEHATGKQYVVKSTGAGCKVVAANPAPVISKPHADHDSLAIEAAANGQSDWTSTAAGAVKDWKQKGASSAAAATLSEADLGSIYARAFPNEVEARRAAGLLMHKTGKAVSVGDAGDDGTFHLSFDHNAVAPQPAYPGEHSGYPNPAEYQATSQSMAGITSDLSAAQVQAVIAKHHAAGDHVAGDWAKAYAQAQGFLGESDAASPGATPSQQQQLNDASLAKQQSYHDLAVSPAKASQVALDLGAALAKGDSAVEAFIAHSINANDTGSALTLAAIAQSKFQNISHANDVADALTKAGVSAKASSEGGWHVNITGGVHLNHIGAVKGLLGAKTPPKVQSPSAPPNTPQGPLFADGSYAPLSPMQVKSLKSTATKFGAGKLGSGMASSYASQIEGSPMRLAHLATVPMTKLTADRFASLINQHGSKYTAIVTKKFGMSGNFQYVLHLKPKVGAAQQSAGGLGTIAPPLPKFDKTFMEKHGGANPLSSETPLALKMANSSLLPSGVGKNDVSITNPKAQALRVHQLEFAGLHDSAAFLQASYAHQNKEARHPKAAGQKHYIGAVQNHPSPLLTSSEILDQITNGIVDHETGEQGKTPSLPANVTPAMLHASTPGERAHALSEVQKGQTDHYGTGKLAKTWLQEYFDNRDVANGKSLGDGNSTVNSGFKTGDPYSAKPPTSTPITREFQGGQGVTIPTALGRKSAHETSFVPQRTAKIKGISGTMHDPTHLDVAATKTANNVYDPSTAANGSPSAGQTTLGHVTDAAKKKTEDIFGTLLTEHKEQLAAGDEVASRNPFNETPGGGPVEASMHAHKMAVTMFAPMLAAARAALPAEGVLRELSQGGHSSPRARDVSKGVFEGICEQLGVSPQAVDQMRSNHQSWYGSTQDTSPRKLKIASNMLRGRDPDENIFPGTSQAQAEAQAADIARTITPDYLKAYLAHKAVTQAAMERYVDGDGGLTFLRGIGSDVGTGMLEKSIPHLINEGKVGKKFHSIENALAGYSTHAAGFNSGGVLHRYVRPEAVWHAFHLSPTHGKGNSHAGEEECFLTSAGGGPKYTLLDHSPTTVGNFITDAQHGSNPFAKATHGKKNQTAEDGTGKKVKKSEKKSANETIPVIHLLDHFNNLVKSLDAAKSVMAPVVKDYGIPVPLDAEGWHRWVPSDWQPSQAHLDACFDANTDKDGVVKLDATRDDGSREQKSDPAIRQAAKDGTLATSTSAKMLV